MALRTFTDAAGVEWQVWNVTPQALRSAREEFYRHDFRGGWLIFECATEKRRLAPIPPDWDALPDEELAHLCRRAADHG